MIILKLKAGLGNQLFEYAYARARALRSNTELKLDISWFENRSAKDTVREYDLSHYNIAASLATPSDFPLRNNRFFKLYLRIIGKIKRDIFGENDYTYYPKYARQVSPSKDVFVEGHFNSEKYFKDAEDTIRKELTLKEPLQDTAQGLKDKLQAEQGSGKVLVLIHVRRGDYITNTYANSFHGTKGTEYYTKAIERMLTELSNTGVSKNNIVFVLASDDIPWVQSAILPLLKDSQHIILSQPGVANFEEIHLMSLCNHFIIANSSFSWWGAWLSTTARERGTQKIVIAPAQWVGNPKVKTPDVLPEEWLRV